MHLVYHGRFARFRDGASRRVADRDAMDRRRRLDAFERGGARPYEPVEAVSANQRPPRHPHDENAGPKPGVQKNNCSTIAAGSLIAVDVSVLSVVSHDS